MWLARRVVVNALAMFLVDPEKLQRYPSVNGSTARMHTDDRTVVIVNV